MISIPLDAGIFVPCLMSGGSDGKASVYNVGDLGSISGLGRFPGEGNGNPLQYSCLESHGQRSLVQATVLGGLKTVGHD